MYLDNQFKKPEMAGIKFLRRGEILREEVFPDDLPSKCDPVGYVDPNVRIKQMQLAGIRMDSWNRALFDFEHCGDEEVDQDEKDLGFRYYSDELEMLTEGTPEFDRYAVEMKSLYRKYLEQQRVAQNPPVVQAEAPVNESEEPKI